MSHRFIDRFCHEDSCVHRLDARVKTLLVLVFLVVQVSTPPPHLQAFVIYAGLLLWATALARIPPGQLLGRAALVLPFSAFVALGLPFLHGGQTVTVLGLQLSQNGLWLLFGATIKSLLAATAVILLMATTPFSRLLGALRHLGAPVFFIDILAMTQRYLSLLIEEATRLRRAAIARGYVPKWLPQSVIVGRLAGSLFVRSYERAERVYGAMRLRGYTGLLPSAPLPPLARSDWWLLLSLAGLFLAVRLVVR